jgi:chloride channel protein, CIC family
MPPTPGESAVAGAARHGRGVFRSRNSRAREAAGPEPVRRPRRALGSAVAHAPQVLRALVRADEVWLLVLAAGMGVTAGIAVWLINEAAQLFHQTLFGIGPEQRLSAMDRLSPIATVVVPCLGGLALGLITLGISRIYTLR